MVFVPAMYQRAGQVQNAKDVLQVLRVNIEGSGPHGRRTCGYVGVFSRQRKPSGPPSLPKCLPAGATALALSRRDAVFFLKRFESHSSAVAPVFSLQQEQRRKQNRCALA